MHLTGTWPTSQPLPLRGSDCHLLALSHSPSFSRDAYDPHPPWHLHRDMCPACLIRAPCLPHQDAREALRLYTKALGLFVWFDRGKERAAEDIPWVNSIATQVSSSCLG